MKKIAFDNLNCLRTGHYGVTDDHVVLKFYLNQSTSPSPVLTWPTPDTAIKIGNNESADVNQELIIPDGNVLSLELWNWHENDKGNQELFGTYTFPDSPDQHGVISLASSDYNDKYSLEYKLRDIGVNTTFIQILGVYCVKPASGIDADVLNAVTATAAQVADKFAEQLKGAQDPRAMAAAGALNAASAILNGVGPIAAAIDKARNDADQLCISMGAAGTVKNKIIPLDADSMEMRNGHPRDLDYYDYKYPVIGTTSFTLYEADKSSPDDSLNGFFVSENDPLGYYEKIVVGPLKEGSIYVISYALYQ